MTLATHLLLGKRLLLFKWLVGQKPGRWESRQRAEAGDSGQGQQPPGVCSALPSGPFVAPGTCVPLKTPRSTCLGWGEEEQVDPLLMQGLPWFPTVEIPMQVPGTCHPALSFPRILGEGRGSEAWLRLGPSCYPSSQGAESTTGLVPLGSPLHARSLKNESAYWPHHLSLFPFLHQQAVRNWTLPVRLW